MKIAIASSGLGHVARGIESWAADLGLALAGRGEDVTLFKGGGCAEADFERVVPCLQRGAAGTARLQARLPRRVTWRLGLGDGYGIEQTSFAFRLLGHLRAGRFDLLHVQDSHVALIAERARRFGLVRTRTILAHGTEETPAFLKKFDYLQHLTPSDLEGARAAGAWKPSWTAIPNFIDTDAFRPGRASALKAQLGIPADGLVVLACAAIKRHHKRIDYLIDEWGRRLERDPAPTAWLVVAGGRESDTDELVARGRALLGDRVRFLVGYPRSRMPELYRLADVFVLCSLREMMPIALLEATASGLPCLVNRHAVLEWIIGPGGDAIDMAAPGALAGALAALLADAGRRARLGQLARQYCFDHFRRDRVVGQVLDYYRRVHTHRRPLPSPPPAALLSEPVR